MDGFRSLKKIVERDFGCVTLRTRLVINLLDRKEKPELLGVPRIDNQTPLIDPKIEKINPILILIERDPDMEYALRESRLEWQNREQSRNDNDYQRRD